MRRYCFAGPVLAAVALAAPAQDKANYDRLLKELETSKGEFVKAREKARQNVLNKFEEAIKRVPNARGRAETNLDVAERLAKEKSRFQETEDFPNSQDWAPTALQFGAAVDTAYRPVGKKFDEAMKAALRLTLVDEGKRLKGEKEAFDGRYLPGLGAFAARTTWVGSRFDGNDATPFRLRVGGVEGTVWKGQVNQNYKVAGHPEYQVEGDRDGLQLRFGSKGGQAGKARALEFKGYVVGDTMILRVTGLNPKGKPVDGRVVLHKNK